MISSSVLRDFATQNISASRARNPPVSLRLGHATALTVPRTVIHYRVAASLPAGEGLGLSRSFRLIA